MAAKQGEATALETASSKPYLFMSSSWKLNVEAHYSWKHFHQQGCLAPACDLSVQGTLANIHCIQAWIAWVIDLQTDSHNKVHTMASAKQAQQVLVVDDNLDVVESLSALLQCHGYDTAAAHNGYEACDAVREALPRAIIMDLGMPWMDGFGAVRAIRRMPGAKQLPIIALTGSADQDSARKAVAAGFSQHFSKPLNFDHLNQYLSSLA
ncbi:response regulator [Rugamonas aquatica]|uniref:response regulator n=1 Tax=Rugamonas aquatica TaxID=2743357 RepID=UPI0015838EDF|nr:response regulator [Rugamonas aquatica]